MVSAVGTLRQTLSIVTDSFRVATHIAVIKARSVTRGAISMATHTLLLLLAGIAAIGTIIHTLTLMEEVVLSTLWEREEHFNLFILRQPYNPHTGLFFLSTFYFYNKKQS